MSKYLSRKIKFLSLFSIIAVVFIHAYNYKDNFLLPTTVISEGANPYAVFQYFFSNALCRFAVPMFFIFSGYLFFRNFVSIKESYAKKLKTRLFSIVIPYLCWTVISGVIIIAFSYVKGFNETEIVKNNAITRFAEFFNFFINPSAFQLWFLQQLIIFSVISPIIYLAVKYTKGIILIPIGVFWLLDINFILNSQGLFFFCVGAAFAIFKQESFITQKDCKILTTLITICWVTLSCAITYFAVNDGNYYFRLILYKANEVFGVVSMWMLFDHIFNRWENKKTLVRATNNSFFIYVLHEPLLHLCYQFALIKGTGDNLTHTILYICLPICIIFLCIFVSAIIRKTFKPLHNILSGGRLYGGKIRF